ncbi:hypothetical protein [Thiohalorhabdus sp.]|uniref:hypothetical protein n=1 Tax=Thiohalorhabdus sp. TaxID=3094134 RepID=UPI002FC371A3
MGRSGDNELEGGAGFDTYEISGGTSTLTDSGGNSLILNGKRVTFLRKTGAGQFTVPGTGFTATRNSPLTISGPGGASVTLQNWSEGDFGIHTWEMPGEPQTTRTIAGDYAWKDTDSSEPGIQYGYDDLGNRVYKQPLEPNPGQADPLYDSAGNDHILPRGGDDDVNAFRGGDDHIEGAGGRDRIEAGPDGDLIAGGSQADRIFGGSETDLSDAIAAGNAETNGSGKADKLGARSPSPIRAVDRRRPAA